MGPITLFDKSFLQSLSVDESVWFDNFFLTNVCPLFYAETLADLEKSVCEGRTPEDEVRIIAQKFPELHGSPNAFHVNLCIANLMRHDVPMTGQIPLAGGRPVRVDGKIGMVFEQSSEAEAFIRWQREEFLEIEREHAKAWREALTQPDSAGLAERFRAAGIDNKFCKSLEQTKKLAESAITGSYRPSEIMNLIHFLLNIPLEKNVEIFSGWRRAAFPPLTRFAPYAAYTLTVELFFQLAMASGLISAAKRSNRVDMAYLHYLPFCMLFVSSDRLHQRTAPLFLRSDQEFVWGPDLKRDLNRLNGYYTELPDSTKEKGIMSFADAPPKEGDFLVACLWDRHLPRWRERGEGRRERKTEDGVQSADYLKRVTDAPSLAGKEADFRSEDVQVLSVKRRVRARKGSWYQVPRELQASDQGADQGDHS